MSKKIKLTRGKYAIVDDEDFVYINRFTWQCMEKGDRAIRTINVRGEHLSIPMEAFLVKNKKGHIYMHKNCNNLDNRKANICLVHKKIILARANKRKTNKGRPPTSLYKGVSFVKRSPKWEAKVNKDGKGYYCGLHNLQESAARAYNEKAKELYGDFAYQNKI